MPSFDFRPDPTQTVGLGRPRIRAGLRDVEGDTERVVYTYRLAAVAWGIIDGLGDEREVHHDPEVPCLTAEWALSAVEPDEHTRLTVARALERRARADGGER